ncbi:hypothetical protein MKZ08_14250 [Viridibacillus sp. FSL R5-0477]|uniref:Putative sodium-dependent transporter n=1 Tax=Viridibacillus arenosi FSL R5-213 TaxID=1227360 RepID=W4EJU1_9BACL|nr:MULTISPECIES: hypothetical protein [Viridibacillus]ETT80835.1 putative sodium-dependent transporter [Viridibacillus arenosi FSL R5-213]OMC78429.1 hypothetical protein BK130_20560 [Viridibacillus sp. FSL H8-0123]OMC92965.1 hypothetical protein BK137_00060 [Viridibacillus arenosi]
MAAVTKNDSIKRMKAIWLIDILIFIVEVPSCLSYGALTDVQQIIFDLMDYAVSDISMPLGRCIIDRDFCILEYFKRRFVCRN